jgi:AGZA family xanthine/uracil permease-like MFS transporter
MSTFEQAPQGAEPRTPGHVESAPARAAVGSASGSGLLERVFKLAEHNTTVRIELVAGLTTFLTMAYIIFVNPSILGDAGMPKGAVFVATCIIAALGTLIMGLYANYPIAMAPGMGLNAYFSYVVVLGMGYTWQVALGAVFISGCLFLVVTVTGLRKLIIDGIPHSLRTAITVGIGMFLALVALKSAGVVAASPATFVTLGDLHTPPVILATLGFFVIVVLDRLKVRGAILIGILAGDGAVVLRGRQQVPRRVRGAAVGGAHLHAAGHHGRAEGRHPERGAGVLPGRDVRRHRHADGRGQARRAAGARQDGAHEPALLADSGAIFAGSLLGTSSTTAYVESAAGVQAGGRTGLTAVVVALLFLACLMISPLAGSVPAYATAPALFFVGCLMLRDLVELDWDDTTEVIPAALTALAMPFTYSIATGLAFGFISYAVLKLFTGRAREVHVSVWIIAAVFLFKFAYVGAH